jgi:octanoyl-[GcvH]:protein N-octanoyltransferase
MPVTHARLRSHPCLAPRSGARQNPRVAGLRLIEEPTPGRPDLGTAVSHAILARVAGGQAGATFRLHRTGAVAAFGRQDANSPGFDRAVEAARDAGFVPVLRLAGGRAAVFHTGTLAFAHATPEAYPQEGTRSRFEATGDLMAAALRRLGVDARVGEVPGEYCPGAYSVNARGAVKIVGVGQRLVAGAAHVGGVIVAQGGARVRDALVPIYDALGLEWDPATCGSVAGEVPGATVDDVVAALVSELRARHDVRVGPIDEPTMELARDLAPEHAISL